MSSVMNIYCDESCHLEHDHIPAMVLGALVCPMEERRRITECIWTLKEKYGLARDFEAKWTKVSPAKKAFYEELITLFFTENALNFRAVVIPDKSRLDHGQFGQSHDDFYYKMYYRLLTALLENSNRYRIYLDIKDTHGQKKVDKLHEVLCNAHLDFDRNMIERIQQVHSHEVELMQLTDLLIGALAYRFRNLTGSQTKLDLIEQIKLHSKLSLSSSSLLSARKFNLFVWEAQGASNVAA